MRKVCRSCGCTFKAHKYYYRYCEDCYLAKQKRRSGEMEPYVDARYCNSCGKRFTPRAEYHHLCAACYRDRPKSDVPKTHAVLTTTPPDPPITALAAGQCLMCREIVEPATLQRGYCEKCFPKYLEFVQPVSKKSSSGVLLVYALVALFGLFLLLLIF